MSIITYIGYFIFSIIPIFIILMSFRINNHKRENYIRGRYCPEGIEFKNKTKNHNDHFKYRFLYNVLINDFVPKDDNILTEVLKERILKIEPDRKFENPFIVSKRTAAILFDDVWCDIMFNNRKFIQITGLNDKEANEVSLEMHMYLD